MFTLLGKIPPKVYLACSGGIDSMVILDFLLKGRRDVEVLYYHHNTPHGEDAYLFLKQRLTKLNIVLHSEKYTNASTTENDWRDARYAFFSKFQDRYIITCHHLDDNIETWLMSSIKGTPKFIPYSRGNIIRPFLLVRKDQLVQWKDKNDVQWIEDTSNSENKYSRNKIRNQVIPVLLEVNPGLHKTFYDKCLAKYY